MRERDLQTLIRIEAASQGITMFRNNVGRGFTADGSRIQFGLCPGSSDLIGWRTVTVTPDMVGRQLAVFVAIEVKTPHGKLSSEQQRFLDAVTQAGGFACVARSPDDLKPEMM